MTVLGHAVLFEDQFTSKKHCVGEDSHAVAPLVGDVLKNVLQLSLKKELDFANGDDITGIQGQGPVLHSTAIHECPME